MDQPVPTWVVLLMRAGYLARGIVYGLIGLLAVRSALTFGRALGAEEALASLVDESFGRPLLWVIAGGAFCFAVWSILAASMDLDGRGGGAWGILARLDFALTGAIYVVIGIVVSDLAANGRGSTNGEGREESAAWIMSLPAGGWLVIALGIGFIVAGIWFGYKAFAGIYRQRLVRTPMVEWLDPVCRFGWTAYGIVIVILGSFLIWAGWTMDPSRAGGFAEAFTVIRQGSLGWAVMLLIAFGFLAFAVECLVEAVFRFVPGERAA